LIGPRSPKGAVERPQGIVLTTLNQLDVIVRGDATRLPGSTSGTNFVVPFMVSAWGCSAGAASRARSASLAAEVLDQGEDDALVSVLLEVVAGVREPQHAIANVFSKSCSITLCVKATYFSAHEPASRRPEDDDRESLARLAACTTVCGPSARPPAQLAMTHRRSR
jgi:hypothetical protein